MAAQRDRPARPSSPPRRISLDVLIWFSAFPPSTDPVIDGTHTVDALVILLLMLLHAGRRWGSGRWREAHLPAVLR